MDSDPVFQSTESPQLNLFGKVVQQFASYGQNASNNVTNAISNLSPEGWLRLIAIAGGYMLMRPYLMKWAGKRAVENMEERDEQEQAAEMSANEFRGIKKQLDEHDYEQTDENDWGQKARVRQRKILKSMLEEQERKLQEDAEDDEDIKEFLID